VAFHERVYGRDFAYFQFAAQFKAELFDPAEWARIFNTWTRSAQWTAGKMPDLGFGEYRVPTTSWRSPGSSRGTARP
jgi:hypothetical protein